MESPNMPTTLLIANEPSALFSIAQALAQPQYALIFATTAREGLSLIRLKRPDVVMLDMALPDQSGHETYSRIRQLDATLPVIVMTAIPTEASTLLVTCRGAFDVLVRPIDSQRLRDVIGSAVQFLGTSEAPTESQYTETPYPFVELLKYVRQLLAQGDLNLYRQVSDEFDRHVLHEVLSHFRGNQLQTSERLGISRMTLRSKLRAYGLLKHRTRAATQQN
jgi:DNA-binding NtrC family response regulator